MRAWPWLLLPGLIAPLLPIISTSTRCPNHLLSLERMWAHPPLLRCEVVHRVVTTDRQPVVLGVKPGLQTQTRDRAAWLDERSPSTEAVLHPFEKE